MAGEGGEEEEPTGHFTLFIGLGRGEKSITVG